MNWKTIALCLVFASCGSSTGQQQASERAPTNRQPTNDPGAESQSRAESDPEFLEIQSFLALMCKRHLEKCSGLVHADPVQTQQDCLELLALDKIDRKECEVYEPKAYDGYRRCLPNELRKTAHSRSCRQYPLQVAVTNCFDPWCTDRASLTNQ